MSRTHPYSRFIVLALVLLGACSQQIEVNVKARIDGQPATQARVAIDGVAAGVTDAQGAFAQRLSRKPGSEVEVTVNKEANGYRIEPWKSTFLVKLQKGEQVDAYPLVADLKAVRFVTLRVNDRGAPVPGAQIAVGGRDAGVTDAKGEIEYAYQTQPEKGAEFSVSKDGYSPSRALRKVEPGQVVELAISRLAVVTIKALSEEYGRSAGVAGLAVSIDGKSVGKTDSQGAYTYDYRGEPGRKAVVALSAPGYIPAAWKTTVRLEGQLNLQHYFTPTTPRPIRVGLYRVSGNTPGADLKEVAAQAGQALSAQLFKFPGFREVPADKLQAEVEQRKLGLDRLLTKGWQDTPLRASVDMIVLGSVAKDDDGYLVEARFHGANGKVVASEIVRARSARGIDGAVRELVSNVIERFPFEGTVVAVEDERYRINLGRNWRIRRGAEFSVATPRLAEGGKVAGYRETGVVEVKRGDDNASLVEIASLKKGEKVQVGDRVVRRSGEADSAEARASVLLTAKGGVGGDVSPLAGANVYLNGEWKGTTGTNGQAEIPLRPGRSYTLLLYRHGYQQVVERISAAKSGEAREFVLAANNAVFKVDSEPSQASVYVDGELVGKTPIEGGKPLTLGFHNVRITYGEDYRDFSEVMEFSKKEEDRTGERRIVLQKDFIAIGERARGKGDIDGAIKAYASTGRDHPDYAEAHRRLGDIYLDDKEDYDRAIAEFETVLALPENQQLIHKQFAVTFTNLGHAYTEKGNRQLGSDRDGASKSFASAIKALQTARQNTRFFPKAEYDEAVHDTYYYTALSYHKLYLITKQASVQNNASQAWREYFDFFPKQFEGNPTFVQARESARRYRDQIQEP